MERKEIEKIIITAFNDYLETQGIEGEVTSDTILFGSDAELDSDRAMSRKSSPFRTVATLADFILELIEEASG